MPNARKKLQHVELEEQSWFMVAIIQLGILCSSKILTV